MEAPIHATSVLINLLGSIAVLLWGLRMVQGGVRQAFGARLRRAVMAGTRHPLLGMGMGIWVTTLLQSSTATALIVSSFVRHGMLATAPALAVMLGADVGTSLVVQVLAFDLTWLAPVLLVAGVAGYSTSGSSQRQYMAQAVIGLGLMLLALRLIVGISLPVRDAPVLQALLLALADEPVVLVLLAAVLTWLAHSSLAVVLLVAAVASSGVLTLQPALALIVGANVGGALPQLTATLGAGVPARRVVVGNLLFKLCAAVVGVGMLTLWPQLVAAQLAWLAEEPGRQVAHFHTGFNLALAAGFGLLTGPASTLLHALMPDAASSEDRFAPRHLHAGATVSPTVALANAERETLRMGDVVERMLARSLDVLATDDANLMRTVEDWDDQVDALHQAIKFYLTDLSRGTLSEDDSHRAQEILSFTINLEHIGDIIDKNLMELAAKKIRQHVRFSDEGLKEITNLHARTVQNLHMAFAVFMSRDVEMARQLLVEKARYREWERRASESHLDRLRTLRAESIDSSAVHLDVLSSLKRINSHVTSVAYPILEQAGELFPSRLKPQD